MDTKVCKKCGLDKSLDLFYNDKKSKDGKCFRCKVCMNATTYANYQKKRKPKKDWSTDPGFKICRKCLAKKPTTDFNVHYGKTRTRDRLRNECRDCQKSHATEHYQKVKVEWNQKRKEERCTETGKYHTHKLHLKRKFGLTKEEYQVMFDSQGGKCAICGADDPRGRSKYFYVDHDHVTGKVRGLLCSPCNTGIGQFKDSLDLVKKAVEYLNRS